MFPPSKLSDVKQDSTEQFKITRLPVFRQNWIHLSLQFKGVQTGVLKYIFKKLLVIWLTFYEKQNNGNLDELKQDSYYSLWLDYNILLSSKSPGNHFLYFQTTLCDFPYPTSGMNCCL